MVNSRAYNVRNCLFMVVCSVTLGVCVTDTSFAQEPSRKDSAREHFQRGMEFYEEGRYDAALAEFQRAYDLAPAHQALYNLGRVHAALGHAVESARAYEQYLKDARGRVPRRKIREVRAALRREQSRIARLVVDTPVRGAVVSIDGSDVASTPLTEPIFVSAGSHTVEVRAPGYASSKRSIRVAGGVERRIKVDLSRMVERSGTLRIVTSVPGVDVQVDGRPVGRTPLDATVPVASGEHEVTGTRLGYKAARQTVQVPDGAELNVRLELVRSEHPRTDAVGRLRLRLPDAPYVLRVDEEVISTRDNLLSLPAGVHQIDIEMAERRPFSQQVTVPVGSAADIVPALEWTPDAQASRYRTARRRRRVGKGLLITGLLVAGGSGGVLGWNEREITRTDDEILAISDECRVDCADSVRERGESLRDDQSRQDVLRAVSIVGVALGAASMATGIVLWVATPGDREIDRKARFTSRVHAGPGSITWRSAF